MSVAQLVAQQLAQSIAALRLAERDAGQAIARVDRTYAAVRTRYSI